MIKQCITRIGQNWSLALPLVLMIGLAFALMHSLFLLRALGNEVVSSLEKKITLSVYIKEDADPFLVGNLVAALEKRPDVVAPVIYTSQEDAWRMVSRNLSLENSLLSKYDFSLPASITVTPISAAAVGPIEEFIGKEGKALLAESTPTSAKRTKLTNDMVQFIEDLRKKLLYTTAVFMGLFVIMIVALVACLAHLHLKSRSPELHVLHAMSASTDHVKKLLTAEASIVALLGCALGIVLIQLLPLPQVGIRLELNLLLGQTLVFVGLSTILTLGLTHLHFRHENR